MKYKLEDVSKLHYAYHSLKERSVPLTGEIIKGVTIPAKKSKAGYWLGRLEAAIKPIAEIVEERRKALIKEMGEEIKKDDEGTGEYKLAPKNVEAFNKNIKALLAEEEEINFCPLKYEHLDDLALPEEFWGAIVPFLTEPEDEPKKNK